jgi:hypothetical protein
MRGRRANSTAILTILVLFFIRTLPLGAAGPVVVALATWDRSQKEAQLVVSLEEHLAKKQRDLINSGFSAHSDLEVRSSSDDGDSVQILFHSQCAVKFDTWEEVYDITRLDRDYAGISSKSFGTYATTCLTARITGLERINELTREGRVVRAVLKVTQIPTEKAAKVREWLIEQQSGVMQGLFSHMLGDLKLFQELEVVVQIPPSAAKAKDAQLPSFSQLPLRVQ